MSPSIPPLGARFEAALVYAAGLHMHQRRKGSGIPYVAHLLSVAALVIEDGAGEDEAVAALLHDAAEDQGGLPRLREIAARFGDPVAAIVAGCSDWLGEPGQPKPAWRPRKQRYIAHLQVAPAGVLRVSLADKLHNARSILADYRTLGDTLFERFTGGKSGTLWYYRALVDAYDRRGVSGPLLEELRRVVDELERLAGA